MFSIYYALYVYVMDLIGIAYGYGMDLKEGEDIKRQQKYTEELYKKDLHYPDNHNGLITNLEPDMSECEVKWALESITTNKASGWHSS